MSALHFDCPMSLLARGLRMRAECAADLPALRTLYRDQRWIEFAVLPWDDATRAAFIDQQFEAQQSHYMRGQEQVLFLVLLEGERVVGRFYLGGDAAGGAVRLMDILLLPDYRRQGLGTALIAALIEQAAADGRDVSLQVDRGNPAAVLYRRLGFHVYADTDIAWQMVWSRTGHALPDERSGSGASSW